MPANRPRVHRGGPPLAVMDEGRRDRLLELIRAGVPLRGAAVNVGIGPRTLFRSLERGRNAQARQEAGEDITDPGDRVCLALFLEVARARSVVMVENVDVVRRAARGGYVIRRTTRSFRGPDGKMVEETTEDLAPLEWRAAQWLLTQSFKNEFRLGQDDPVLGDAASEDPVSVDGPEPRALEAVAARLAAVRAEREADGDEVVVAEVVDDDR